MTRRYRLDAAARAALKQRLRDRLSARPEVRFAYVHGGFHEAERFADVDVAVSLYPGEMPPAGPAAYELDLQGLLERDLGLPVDVRIVDNAPPSFRYAVTRGDALLVRDPDAWADFRERTWNEYLDFAPLREEALRDLAQMRKT